MPKLGQKFLAGRGDQLGGGAGGGCAQIGYEVGDGEVGLVADGGNDGDFRAGDGSGEDFLVKVPEVFEGTSAAPDDQDFGFWGSGLCLANGAGDGFFGPFSLNGDGEEKDLEPRRAAVEDVEDVLEGGAAAGGDKADDLRGKREGFAAGDSSKRPSVLSFNLRASKRA